MNLLTRSTFIILVVACVISATATTAAAEDNTCYIRALNTDVYVEVYDLDREGETNYRIWQGRLKDGEEVMIKTDDGLIQYYYTAKPDVNQPSLKGGVDRLCTDKRVIGVP